MVFNQNDTNHYSLYLPKQSNIDLIDIYKHIGEICLQYSIHFLSTLIGIQVSYTDFSDTNGYENYGAGRTIRERAEMLISIAHLCH